MITRRQQPDLLYHTRQTPCRVRPARETQDEDLIPGFVMVHQVFIGVAQQLDVIPAFSISSVIPAYRYTVTRYAPRKHHIRHLRHL